MMVQHLSDQAKAWIDLVTVSLAGVAAVSLSQAALAVTFGAGLISIVLGCIRIHDRLKYGRSNDD